MAIAYAGLRRCPRRAPFSQDQRASGGPAAQLVEDGCGKSVLYREFATRDASVPAYLQQFDASRAEREQAAVADAEGPHAQLRALIGVLVQTSARPDFRGCPFRRHLREFSGSST